MINFNEPTTLGCELDYIKDAIARKKICGDGYYTKACHELLEKNTGAKKALLANSCTAALEMAALLSDLKPGDEVIVPSFTFVTTASAFALRGAVPVFVDIRDDTLNLDESKIEAAITPKTKVIVPVHYAGVSADMDKINEIAKKHGLLVVEDAAQAVGSKYKGKACGTCGDMGCYSFHETKNVVCGEGGALLLNREELIEPAEIVREKGTNRSKFFRGQVDKYTWVELGSSYLPSEMVAAYLYPQLQNITKINGRRMELWKRYNEHFKSYEEKGLIKRPYVPAECEHNAHMYYLRFNDIETRTRFISYLKENDVLSVFHYIPLHSSPAGMKYGRVSGELKVTDKVSDTLVRLPLFYGLQDEQFNKVLEVSSRFLKGL